MNEGGLSFCAMYELTIMNTWFQKISLCGSIREASNGTVLTTS